MDNWEQIWRFDTHRFTIVCEVAPCQDDPSDCFGFDDDVEAVRSGSVAFFDARVRVLFAEGDDLGSDYLGACAYASPQEFIAAHRDRNPMNRNSSIMRQAKGDNAVICHYFPSMVAEAIAAARKKIARICEHC